MNKHSATKASAPAPRTRSARARNLYILGLAQVALMAWIGLNVVTGNHDDADLASNAPVTVASSQR